MEVIYTSNNLIDKTRVLSVDKTQGTAKLANGIILNREILKKGYFKRAGIRSDDKAYLYEEGSEGYRIYESHILKYQLKNLLPKLQEAVGKKNSEDYEWLKDLKKIITKYLE